MPVEGRSDPIRINRYVVAKGSEKSLVLYWYQSRDRVVANELAGKYWLVVDSIRHHRSDTAIVRVVVPVAGDGETQAMQTGVEFVKSVYPILRQRLPS